MISGRYNYKPVKTKPRKTKDEEIQREINQDLHNALERYRALVKTRRIKEALHPI
ncbi:MAG: hypothetical protein LF888_05710 [Candidatus Megaira endosymbiont of Mesostigma viride]|jgi:hypothetical protein|nr:MAG: hypothetical protein LF888_05710 [Candidatus Megaira endosymbiont of Mesostigma viride]HJK88915.1 hypothetical protein [Candidatus Megaira endosymbiont of Mesostigma viride]